MESLQLGGETDCGVSRGDDLFPKDVGDRLDRQLSRFKDPSKVKGKKATLYIFVSLSLHKNLLENLLQDAKRYGGTLVFRGLMNGSFRETLKVLYPIIEKSGVGVTLDPVLFKRFKVDRVPTVVLTKDDRALLNQQSDETMPHATSFDKLAGTISIPYALELFAKKGDLKSDAKRLMEAGHA